MRTIATPKYLRLLLLLGITILLGIPTLWLMQQNNVNSLAQQINGLQQQINALPETVAPKDKLALEKDRLTLEKDRVNAQNAIYGTLIQALGSVFFFVTAYFTWRNLKVAEENLRTTQQKQETERSIAEANLKATQERQVTERSIAEANIKATEEKQVTERFSKAIEMLGSDKLEVRLGAIYALERIAKDSKNDYWSIMEVLTAYMREEGAWLAGKEREKFPTDLQAILTIIGRRTQVCGKGKEHLIDLSGTDLRMANFIGDGFQGVNFTGANFEKTYLNKANFQGADLTVAQLQGADLTGANFTEANLTGADLRGAINLTQEQISKATTDEATTLPYYLQPPESSQPELPES